MPATTASLPPAAKKPSPTLLDPWVWRMAWRDSRRSRGRLLVFSTALTLGVAALVAIGSLGWNLQRAIHEQARTLVGADVVLEGTDAARRRQRKTRPLLRRRGRARTKRGWRPCPRSRRPAARG